MGFWNRLMGRRDASAIRGAEETQVETPNERRVAAEGVEGLAADELAEQQLGGVDPTRIVDDEFKP